MNLVIDRLYESADALRLGSGITRSEGLFIHDLVRSNALSRTLEVGCAFGFSSVFICDASAGLPDSHHVVIDPFQYSEFGGHGVKALERSGFTHWELIERPSEYELARRAEAGERFDFCFIDGCHTFDHTLLDFFYINRLLRVGGIVVFDDVSMPAVNRVVKYVATYPCYRVVGAVNERGWRRSALNAIKLLAAYALLPLTRVTGSALSHEFLDHSLVRPGDLRRLDYATMIAFRKQSEDERGCEWYQYAR
jgi:predicted O-methyltransferase YrrM